jgi:hypothetical protein
MKKFTFLVATLFVALTLTNCGGGSSSSSYSTHDGTYGEYHDINGNASTYKGSVEQQKELYELDKRMAEDPNF